MKPAFALSLSFEGISLLHRAAGGWRRVGAVTLDVPDLVAALADLRDKALLLEPDGLTCKLIIPNDQIRYLTLDTGRAEGEARRARVREALDGATPYAVSDLAFDISIEATLTHVAAVARETLAEAETFAVEHGFNPVSFVAVPGDQPFLGEPFFGTTEAAGAQEVEPDGIAVVITGDATIPEPAPEPEHTSEPAAEEVAEEPAAAEVAEEPAPKDDAEAPAEKPAEPDQDEDATQDAKDAPDAKAGTDPEHPEAEPETETETGEKADAPANPDVSAEIVPPAVGFSSRRGKEAAPALAGASRDEAPAGAPAPSLAATAQSAPATAKPVGAPPADTKPPKAGKPAKASKAAKPTKTKAAEPAAAKPKAARKPKTKPADKPALGRALRTRAAGLLASRKAAAAKPAATPAAAADSKPSETADEAGKSAPLSVHPIAQPPAAQSFTSTRPEAPQDEAERMTVFGARQTQSPGGKPRRLGLILTAVLLFLLVAIGAWAALFTDGGIARLFSGRDAPRQVAEEPAPTPATQDDTTEVEAPPATGPTPAQPPMTSALSPQTPPPAGTDDTGETAAQATGPDAAAPQAEPSQLSEVLTDTDSAVLDALRADNDPDTGPDNGIDTDIDQPAPLDAEDIATLDPELEPEPEPAPADTGPDSDTFYATTGIWPAAPTEPETPAIIGLDDLYVAAIDRTDLAQDAVALPQAGDFATDTALNAVTSPAAAGTAFALDDRGLVSPSPEGTVSPDGITVYLGRPPVVPPATPDRTTPAEEAATEADALRQRLAGLRPRLRPGDLVEQTERAQLGGRSREELGRLRPRVRPASAQDDAAAETPADAPASAQAVAAALIPKPRPSNFQETVRSSNRASIGIPQNLAASAPAAAPATVSPKIPTSASVARQATLKNELNLRRLNLIGVYGTASNRRALVRLPSGRYKKVQVGDRIDGGKVVAIGENQLQYQKGGRNHTLKMPKS